MSTARSADDRTPLSRAAQAGDQGLVEQLLRDARSQFDLDARDNKGRTPLSHAAEHGHAGITSLLLAAGASPNLLDLRRASPLWYAAAGGHADVVAALLRSRRVADVNVKPARRSGEDVDDTPLSIALRKGYREIAGMLAREEGVDPHVKIRLERTDGMITPLGLAARDGDEDVALALLERCGGGEGARCPEPGPELLVLAAAGGSARLVRALLGKHNADPNAEYPYDGEYEFQGKTPLMAASKRGHGAVVRLLLDSEGIQPNARCRYGTALCIAAWGGFRDVVKMLVADERVEAGEGDFEGRTPLALAAMVHHEAVVEELLLVPEKVNPDGGGRGRTPLSWAVGPEYGYGAGGWQAFEGVVRQLLASPRVDPNSRPDHWGRPGDSPLSHAAQRGALGLVQAILEHPATDPDLPGAGITPLALAAMGGHLDIVKALIQTGRVDVNATGNTDASLSGQTVLTLAVEGGHESVVELLLSSPGIEPHKRNGYGKTPLAVAAQHGHVSLVRRLLAVQGADPNSRDEGGRTPLCLAAVRGYHDTAAVVRLLLNTEGTDPDAADFKGQTALSLAAGACDIGLVDILLAAHGVDPDSRDLVGRSPLSWAIDPDTWDGGYQVIDRQKQVIRRLLQVHAVDPNAEDAEGLTPLIRAIQAEYRSELVSLILERDDVDVHRKGKDGRTPMEVAKEHGDTATLSLLRARGALDEVPLIAEEPKDDSSSDDGFATDGTEKPEIPASNAHSAAGRGLRRRRSSRSPARSPSYSDMLYGGSDVDETTKIYLRHELSRDVRLPLGVQEAHPDLAENDANLCPTCEAIEVDELFSKRHTDYGGRVVARLGRVDETWETRRCPMCRLIAAVRPRSSSKSQNDEKDSSHNLVTFSSTGTWLCHDKLASWERFQAPWIDTMVLGVVAASEQGSGHLLASDNAARSVLASGFIARLGSNCPYGTQSITIPRLDGSGIDLATAKGWIAHCGEEHSQRCNPRKLAPVPHFRLIECSTGRIVKHTGSVPPYAALSYVWGPPRPVNGGRPDQDQEGQEDTIGEPEPVVEDAIHVTLGLGYRYLWVDRHCIAQTGNDAVKQAQLRTMHHVYANAEVTLIAAAGQDSSFGLPGTDPLRPRPPQPSARIKTHLLTCIPPDPATLIKASTWATRGWTYQEGLLARRRLFFTEREMSFECHDLLRREAIHLPQRATSTMRDGYGNSRLMMPSWIYKPGGVTNSSAGGIDLFARLAEYTARRLTYASDALNGMLGVLQVFAERARKPVYHICGVPVLHATDDMVRTLGWFRQRRPHQNGSGGGAGRRGSMDDDDDDEEDADADAASLARAGFVNGLCWRLERPAPRREGFPSWSWAGWHGVVETLYGHSPGIAFEYGFDVDVSIVLENDAVVPWEVYFDGLRGGDNKEKQPGLYSSQSHTLGITADVVTVRLCHDDEIFSEEYRWRGRVCVGDGVWEGRFWPTRRDSASAEQVESDEGGFGVGLALRQRLLEESWWGIVLGNTFPPDCEVNHTYVLVLEEQQPSTTTAVSCWERVGLLKLDHSTLEGGMVERRTIRLV
jgi:ankyrin repeat protein